ncbi:hypothetical protein Agabi119p4_8621 [Agaricus bisporus var. burnettii]|uniref:Uncharacterized protein n=1 Tax=Agaricus bisporus var. burnettii TaxID=192524 RepID=A0A8H7EZ56_AGABI|nr:hypothetical protein Agabi119p4_8621 [Agaricus bisporus var. burnettii]
MVFIPGISKRNRKLERRKGGGGGGRGGGGGGSSGGRGGGGGGSGGSGGGRPGSISSGGAGRSTSSRSFGGGSPSTIPRGQPFAGRQQGGGNRNQIYGSRTYGSGYPGGSSRGVAGLGFPFFFYPVVFGAGAIGGGALIYHEANEYGDIHNTSRPGGPLMIATFPSNSNSNSTFRLLADSSTVSSLISDVVGACGSQITNASSIAPSTYNDAGPPGPGQTVQYYRASSIALSLDSYNNTAAFSNDTNAQNSPLPSNIDSTLLGCLNDTIGQNAPLVDGAFGLKFSSPSNLLLVVLVWVVSRLVSHV